MWLRQAISGFVMIAMQVFPGLLLASESRAKRKGLPWNRLHASIWEVRCSALMTGHHEGVDTVSLYETDIVMWTEEQAALEGRRSRGITPPTQAHGASPPGWDQHSGCINARCAASPATKTAESAA